MITNVIFIFKFSERVDRGGEMEDMSEATNFITECARNEVSLVLFLIISWKLNSHYI